METGEGTKRVKMNEKGRKRNVIIFKARRGDEMIGQNGC